VKGKKVLLCTVLFAFFLYNPALAQENVIIVDRTDFPILYYAQPNIKGEAVWMVQARLREIGYEITPNGLYDFTTASVVRLYQTANGLEDDGVVSQEVWESLLLGEPEELCMAGSKEPTKERLLIEIDVSTRRLKLFEGDKLVVEYPVAVGKSSTPSPLGEWKIIHKSTNWGNGFGTRWMGLNVPWGIYGIHGTNKPGSIGTYASHGCIRMFNRDVEKLYPLVPVGTTVKIVNKGKLYPENLKPVVLKKGSTGQSVVYIQSRLKELGLEFDRADGRYGNMTELAVKYFQVWHGLEPTGQMNEETYRAMGMIN
jgi:peptidoglycan hydrolase-like protein with peptidoglycan-binding domain